MTYVSRNLFTDIPSSVDDELADLLVAHDNVRIERIVSTGHASPEGFWYDQDEHEWVIVLKGQARLLFEDQEQPIDMRPGDCVNIAAHRRHRVVWTTPDEATVWLAVFYRE